MNRKYIIQFLLLILAMGMSVSCSRDANRSLLELRGIAVEAQEGAVAAREGKDPGGARKSSDRASTVAEVAAKRLASLEEPTTEQQEVVNEIVSAAKSAELTANLTQEEADLAKELTSWKAKSYRGSRKLLVKGVFLGLSYSAKKVDEQGVDSLPEKVRESAEFGANLVYEYTSLERDEDQEHDWKRISEELEKMADSPPREIAAMLAATYLIAAQKDLALYEIEGLDLNELADRDRKLICQVIRSAVLSSNGYKGLSVEYMHATIEEHKNTKVINNLRGTEHTIEKVDDPQEMLGLLHLGLAYLHLQEKRYEEADREMVNAITIWPNNPLTAFLTGERLLADGKKEEAAESLEAAAAGSEYEWLAEMIAERAKEIRDGKDDSESLVYSARIIGELVMRTMIEKSKDSKASKKLKGWLDMRKSLGKHFTKKKWLPEEPSTEE